MNTFSFIYVWTGVDRTGRIRRGRARQSHRDVLVARLARCGIVLLRARYSGWVLLQPHAWREWWARARAHTQLSLADTTLLLRSIARLQSSGMALAPILQCLASSTGAHNRARAVRAVYERVVLGHSLAQAVRATAQWWPPVVPVALQASEGAGRLEAVLTLLADSLEARTHASHQVWRALLVPLLTAVVAIAVVGGALSVVLPQCCQLLCGQSGQVPPALARLVAVSEWVHAYGLYSSFGLIAGGAVCWRALVLCPKTYVWRDFVVYLVPVSGPLLARAHTIAWLRMLGVLLEVGVSVVPALTAVGPVVGNAYWHHEITVMRKRIEQGASFAQVCRQLPPRLVAPLFSQVAGVATSRVALAGMCQHVAHVLSHELSHTLRVYVAVLQPGLLMLLAGGVALVLNAVLGPLLDMLGSSQF